MTEAQTTPPTERKLTPAQRRALDFLVTARVPMTARDVAEAVWPPDDPEYADSWKRRSHRHRGGVGALGAGRWMAAGRMLILLWDRGLVEPDGGLWRITAAGREVNR